MIKVLIFYPELKAWVSESPQLFSIQALKQVVQLDENNIPSFYKSKIKKSVFLQKQDVENYIIPSREN